MESKLTQDQLDELKSSFAIYDLDGDGKITMRELGSVMRALGHNPTEAEILTIINSVDTDQSGSIDFQEFCKLMSTKMREMDTEEDIIDAFRVFDVEGKGHITAYDLRHVMTNLGEKLTDEEVNAMISEADSDGDGVIHYSDFVKIMTSK
ncbi:hypothetical protein ACKWTF_016848 [Chironomus riparius]